MAEPKLLQMNDGTGRFETLDSSKGAKRADTSHATASAATCGFCADTDIARGLTPAQLPPDDTEFLEIGILPFDEVVQMVLSSEIRDVMTVTGVLIADRIRRLGG